MPKLPDVLDYGRRPGLQSNRLDMPSSTDVTDIMDPIQTAIETFAGLAGKRKAKDDRVNYALAKNEILQSDIAQRQALKDDEDWKTYDERYTVGFNEARDEVLDRFDLSPDDSLLLSAESDLLRERGRVDVGDAARTVELDEKRAHLEDDLDKGRELVLVAPPDTANEIMFSLLDTIKAQEAEGILDDEEATAKSQAFVQDVASARLVSMDPKDRQRELELSLSSRKSGGPITQDDIRGGRGTGSIADFLHADTATALLEQTKRENKIEDELDEAFAIVDEASAMFPEDNAGMMAHIRKSSKGKDSGVRSRAESLGRQRGEERRIALNEERTNIMQSAGSLLRGDDGDPITYDQIPPAQLAKLTPGQAAELERYDRMLRNNQQFADVTNWHNEVRADDDTLVRPAYSTWADMSPEQKVAVDLTEPMWYTNFTNAQWKQMADEQQRIESGKQPADDSVQTNDQILNDVFAEMGIEPDDVTYNQMRSRMADELGRVQEAEFAGKKAPYDRRKEITRQIVLEKVWQRDVGTFGWLHKRDSATPVPAGSLTAKELEDTFVPINVVRSQTTRWPIGAPRGPGGTYLEDQFIEGTWEDRLINIAKSELDGRVPHQKDVENAYAAIQRGAPDAVVLKMLAGEGEH